MKNWMSTFLVFLAFGSKIVVAGPSSADDVIYVGAALSQLYEVSDWSTPVQEEGFKCPVCLNGESDQEVVKLNTCGHSYCKPCLEDHGKGSNCCPSCRTRMNDKVPEVINYDTGMAIANLSEAECEIERDPVLLYMPKAQRKQILERLITECDDLIEHLNHSFSEIYLSSSSCFPLLGKIKNRSEIKRVETHLESVKGIKKSFEKMSQCPGNPGHPGGSFFNYFRTDVGIFEKLKSEIIGQQYTFEIGEVVS